MNDSLTTTTATATNTTQKENTMTISQNKECLKNLECDREADEIRDLIMEEDYEGVQDLIDGVIENKAVETFRVLAKELGIDDISGMVTHRDSDQFQEEIEYILNHIKCGDNFCQGEERAKLAESFGDWDLMIKGGEYFFQHQDPDYVTGNLTMLEPGIVDGRAEAIFQDSNSEYFQVLNDDNKINDIIEDNYKINKLVSRANRWLNQNSTPFDSNQGEEMKPQDAHSPHEELQEEHTMETQSENYEEKYAEECGPDSIVIGSYIEDMIEDFHERGYDEIDSRFRYLIDSADAESVRVFVRELGIGYPVEMFVNDMTKDAKYIQDHSRCGEECIVPKSKRIALANADETSQEFQMMF